jgi:molecular chaperone DnaJ
MIEVEPGTQTGTVHRIRHEGIEHLHGRGHGDLFVHLVVDVPTKLDDTSEELLRKLAEHRGESVSEKGGLFHRRGSKK